MVLCYLEGLTIQAAAARIGCPVGTLGVRLMRARDRLKDRLIRRGLAPDVEPPTAPTAILPGSLVSSTVVVAARIAAGETAPLALATMVNGILRSMAMIRMTKLVAFSLVAMIGVGSVGGASGLAWMPWAEEPPARRIQESWLGKKAIIKYSAPLKEGDQIVSDNIFRVYTIDRIADDQVHLASDEVSGWIEADEVVLLDKAIDFFTRVLQENERDLWAWLKRAQVREYLGDRARAIADLTEGLRIGPPNAVLYAIRGDMLQQDKEYDKAIADFDKALGLTPWAIAYFHRGRCWAEKHDYGRAITDYDEAIRLEPDVGLNYLNRGLAWAYMEEFDRAIADYSKALELGTKYNASTFRFRGTARLDKAASSEGNDAPEAAIADLTEAIRLDPKDAAAYYHRGRAWSLQPEHEDQAIADYDRAIQLDPQYVLAYMGAGMPGTLSASMRRPSRISPRPFGSIRETQRLDTTAVGRSTARGMTTDQSRTSMRPFASIPTIGRTTRCGGCPGSSRRSTTGRARTSMRHSVDSRRNPWPFSIAD